jgi:glutathione synthase/RimK-type ligase-like ATP-grasp enzyme
MVINPPTAMAVNNSKPYQLRLIAGFGFDVPQTLVTTDPSAVRAFAAQHGRLIYKSVSGTRSIVNTLTDTSLERLECVENAPTQFQEYIPGCDVRVHVVGTEVFATEVRSEAHDYRYASLYDQDVELLPVTIPSEVADRCRSMTARMGLAVSGIDLRHTPDDSWVCFEVNPSPAFVYYEAATEQPIGDAIARLLIRADVEHQQLRAGCVSSQNKAVTSAAPRGVPQPDTASNPTVAV